MKKIMTIGVLLTVVIYAMPVFCGYLEDDPPLPIPQERLAVDAEITEDTQTVDEQAQDKQITVLIDGKAQQMALEEYVVHVVAGEISPDFPVQAIRAQAVAARTYALYKQSIGRSAQHEQADVCDNPAHCAAFVDLKTQAAAMWGDQADHDEQVIRQAVQDTAGQVVVYEDKPIMAVFSSAAGEQTERAVDVWGGDDIPYLQNVDSPGGEDCPKYHASVTLTVDEVKERAQQYVPKADLSGNPSSWFKASERSPAGGIIRMKFGGVQVHGTTMRAMLGLNSTNFSVNIDGERLTFDTIGYGHGVGLSQWGARYAAEQGQTYEQILQHYYPGTKIEQIAV